MPEGRSDKGNARAKGAKNHEAPLPFLLAILGWTPRDRCRFCRRDRRPRSNPRQLFVPAIGLASGTPIPTGGNGDDRATCGEAGANRTPAQSGRGLGPCHAPAWRTACAAHSRRDYNGHPAGTRSPRLLRWAPGRCAWPAHGPCNPGFRARRTLQTERKAQRGVAPGHYAVTAHIGKRYRKYSGDWGEQGVSPPQAQSAAAPARIIAVQRALSEFGYGQIKSTGTLDAETQRAIAAFERQRNLLITGRLSERLIRELSAVTGRTLE